MKLKRLFILSFCLLLIAAFKLPPTQLGGGKKLPVPFKVKEFVIEENDTSSYKLNLAYDSLGKPLYFYRNIFTPVCHTNVCLPVYINLYWDLVGNYLTFDFPPGKTLTKLDHEEFAPADYEKMQAILSNKNSLLKDYKMEELVGSKTVVNGVDGVTGATLKTVKKEVIEGAVYTCYTLWHLAHGNIEREILTITDELAQPEVLHQFLQSDNYHYHYFAIDKVFDEPSLFEEFEEDIFEKIGGDNIFLSRYILESFPESLLIKKANQLNLINLYQTSTFSLQKELMKTLAKLTLSREALEALSQKDDFETYPHFELKCKIFNRQPSLPDKTETYLIRQVNNIDTRVSQLAKKLLEDHFPKSPKAKKAIKKHSN